MERKFSCALLSLLLLTFPTACSEKQNQIELDDEVVVSGDAYVSDDCKVMLHFSTFMPNEYFDIVRKKKALTQFVCCDDTGKTINSFSVNREIINRPIAHFDSTTSLGFYDFNLYCSEDSVKFVDDSSSMNKRTSTGHGANMTGYIEETDTAYYLYNMGGNVVEGQYSYVLRFVNAQGSYDVIIPDVVQYVAYDRVTNRFLYRLAHEDDFTYGFIEYDDASEKYVYDGNLHTISIQSDLEKYGDDAKYGYRILLENNIVYEILDFSNNEKVIDELNLDADTLNSMEHGWAVLMLRTFDLNKGTSEMDYLTGEPFPRSFYGPRMSGTQQMPQTAVNGKLYAFSSDEKLTVVDPQGYTQYDVHFNDPGRLNPTALFNHDEEGGDTLGDMSPIRICENGDFYTAHAYQNGAIKIHKYNFDKQKFEPYWTSEPNLLDQLESKSLAFYSFEVFE